MAKLEDGERIPEYFYCIADEMVEQGLGRYNSCGSSDALSIYEHELEDGVTYDAHCFSCSQSFSPKMLSKSTLAEELGMEESDDDKVKTKQKKSFNKKPKKEPISKEELKELTSRTGYISNGYRGIKDKYNKFYGHRTELDEDGNVIAQYYPETVGKDIVGFKCRNHPKDFTKGKLGLTGVSTDLSGQIRFRKGGGKYVLVVGGECYTGDTEVLTDRGFKRFDQLSGEDLIYQHDEEGSSFVKPERFISKDYEGNLINYKSKYIDLMVTPKHKMVSLDYRGREYCHDAQDFPKRHHHYLKNSKIDSGVVGLNLSDTQIKFIIALCADAKIDERKSGKRVAHFSFMKDRKIERLRSILDELELPYTFFCKHERKTTWKTGKKYSTFNVTLPAWGDSKVLPESWLLQMSLKQRELFLSEIMLWDGNKGKHEADIEFSSKLKEECELVYAIAITSGKHAHIRKRSNSLGTWWATHISGRKTTSSYQGVDFSDEYFKGKVYCVTVPSGKIVVRRNGKTLVCGNCDKVAAYQMLDEYQESRGNGEFNTIPVVSGTTGEGSLHKQLAAQYDWLDTFENIVVGLDVDAAGKEAVKKCCEVLPAEKVLIATWSEKDPNDMLIKKRTKQFIRDFYNAKPYISSGIKTSTDLMEDVESHLLTEKLTLPDYMHRLQENMRGGIGFGRVVNIIADSSIGKTAHLNSMVYHWVMNCQRDAKVGVISLESTAAEYALDMLSIHLEKNLVSIPDGKEVLDILNEPEIKAQYDDLFTLDSGEPRFYLVDEREGKISHVEKQIERMIKQYGCNVIVIDVLSDLLRSLDNSHQEEHMMWQKLTVKHGVIIVNSLHCRKPPPNPEGKSRKATEYDALGSSSFVQSAHINIVFNRDKMEEDVVKRNTTEVDMPKCRGGITGFAANWYYDYKTRKVYDYEDYFKEHSLESAGGKPEAKSKFAESKTTNKEKTKPKKIGE